MAIQKKIDALQGLETEVALNLTNEQTVPASAGLPNELLAQLLLKKLKKEADLEEAEEDRRKKLLARNLEMVRDQQAQKELEQRSCTHTKENGKPSVGGQKVSGGHFAFICVRCQCLWDEKTVPKHLVNSLPPGTIGGAL